MVLKLQLRGVKMVVMLMFFLEEVLMIIKN